MLKAFKRKKTSMALENEVGDQNKVRDGKLSRVASRLRSDLNFCSNVLSCAHS